MNISSLVLKTASRCNLNCSYCYMYNLGDNTYKNQPKVMSEKVVDNILIRVKEYISLTKQKHFQFIFHGGEPLLAPIDWYKDFVSRAQQVLPDINIQYSLQTNGVLYDDDWAKELKAMDIHVGFSWDGPKRIHDKFRKFHNNKGSYEEVIAGMDVHRNLTGKVAGLSVINAEVPAKEYYQNVKEINLSYFSLLLPHLHHSMEEEFNKFKYNKDEATFGSWLVDLFDCWWYDEDVNKPNVNMFADFISLILGSKVTNESFGEGDNNVLVIETDGGIESSASLKSIADGFTKEGNSVFNCSFVEVLSSDLIRLFVKSHSELPEACEKCDIKHICGGGRINQRFSNERNFDNPSVYCNDIKLIVSHIQNKLLEGLTQEELDEVEIEKLEYGAF